MVGLNFSDEREADKFFKVMETKIKDREQRRQGNTFLCLLANVVLFYFSS